MSRALIVGANRGIGLEVCKQLAARGDEVIAACRRSSAALDGLEGARVHSGVDVTDRTTVEALASDLGDDSIDLLMVVAGILQPVALDSLDLDAMRRQFEVNAIGPLVTTVALLPCLKRGSRVGLVTSRMGSVADNTSGGSYGYRMSKAALNMAGRSLAHDLHSREVAVRLLHPGWVRTDMTGGSGLIDVDESASGLIACMDELTMQTSGTFLHENGDPLPW